jgi:hypothetical protein
MQGQQYTFQPAASDPDGDVLMIRHYEPAFLGDIHGIDWAIAGDPERAT